MNHDKSHDVHQTFTLNDDPVSTLDVGTRVYVRNRFLGDWSTGFEVAEVLIDGYRIRRLSDGQVFPDVFTFDDVRMERRQQPLREIARSYRDRRQ
ncbi:MAG TPA: hypothetical protein VII76_01640 [Acidimicrobiales bacterium]